MLTTVQFILPHNRSCLAPVRLTTTRLLILGHSFLSQKNAFYTIINKRDIVSNSVYCRKKHSAQTYFNAMKAQLSPEITMEGVAGTQSELLSD